MPSCVSVSRGAKNSSSEKDGSRDGRKDGRSIDFKAGFQKNKAGFSTLIIGQEHIIIMRHLFGNTWRRSRNTSSALKRSALMMYGMLTLRFRLAFRISVSAPFSREVVVVVSVSLVFKVAVVHLSSAFQGLECYKHMAADGGGLLPCGWRRTPPVRTGTQRCFTEQKAHIKRGTALFIFSSPTTGPDSVHQHAMSSKC